MMDPKAAPYNGTASSNGASSNGARSNGATSYIGSTMPSQMPTMSATGGSRRPAFLAAPPQLLQGMPSDASSASDASMASQMPFQYGGNVANGHAHPGMNPSMAAPQPMQPMNFPAYGGNGVPFASPGMPNAYGTPQHFAQGQPMGNFTPQMGPQMGNGYPMNSQMPNFNPQQGYQQNPQHGYPQYPQYPQPVQQNFSQGSQQGSQQGLPQGYPQGSSPSPPMPQGYQGRASQGPPSPVAEGYEGRYSPPVPRGYPQKPSQATRAYQQGYPRRSSPPVQGHFQGFPPTLGQAFQQTNAQQYSPSLQQSMSPLDLNQSRGSYFTQSTSGTSYQTQQATAMPANFQQGAYGHMLPSKPPPSIHPPAQPPVGTPKAHHARHQSDMSTSPSKATPLKQHMRFGSTDGDMGKTPYKLKFGKDRATDATPRAQNTGTPGRDTTAETLAATSSVSAASSVGSPISAVRQPRLPPMSAATIGRANYIPGNFETPTLRSRRGESVGHKNPPATEPMAKAPPKFDLSTAPKYDPTTAKLSPLSTMLHATAPEFNPSGQVKPSPPVVTSIPYETPYNIPYRSQGHALMVAPQMTPAPPNALVQWQEPKPISRELMTITGGNTPYPSVEVALSPSNFPFAECGRQAGNVDYGVVRISNIPYSVTRGEIIAFLGRNAKIVPESEEPVHIIMERVTSKTMDAFIEFTSLEFATMAVEKYDINRQGGRGGRLGERHVELEVTSQQRLMAELFPKAKNVQWHGSRPEVIPRDPNDPYNSGFQGFVSSEELVMLVKHVEAPQRSPFSKECPQRPFECLISTLLKFPWYMVEYITIEARNQLFIATRSLIQLLVHKVTEDPHNIHLNEQLLKRVRRAAVKCCGFTEAQKDDIVFVCGFTAEEAGLAPWADHWPFMTIGPKRGAPADVLEFYIALLREATTSPKQITLAEQAAMGYNEIQSAFGHIRVDYPENVMHMSLAAVASVEWDVIEHLLRRVLNNPSYY